MKKKIKRNKLDKSFGPVGSYTGLALLIAGIAVIYNFHGGYILVVVGAFLGFTSTSCFINSEESKIKFSNNIFGVIPIGKWIEVKPEMKIEIRKNHFGYRTYSRSNRTLDIHLRDFRIVLIDNVNKRIVPIKKLDSLDKAKTELERLKAELGLGSD